MQIRLLAIALFALGAFACSSDASFENDDNPGGNSTLIGKWRLTHTYMDPGDGSGEFDPVSAERWIEFKSNGEISTNLDYCKFRFGQNGINASGTFQETDESGILLSGCDISRPFGYTVNGNTLDLSYPLCREPCIWRFVRK